jgi:hypothetical protein
LTYHEAGRTIELDVTGFTPEPCLPARIGQCDPLPEGIIGAKILSFGSVPDKRFVEGGGLVIDYLPEGQSTPIRVVFYFTELGMGVEAMARLDHQETAPNPA